MEMCHASLYLSSLSIPCLSRGGGFSPSSQEFLGSCKLFSGSGAIPANKCFLVHSGLKVKFPVISVLALRHTVMVFFQTRIKWRYGIEPTNEVPVYGILSF